MSDDDHEEVRRKPKCSYIGAPACFALEMACKQVQAAFAPRQDGRLGQVYIVGSAIERSDWRDVDVRLMLDDTSFAELFPNVILDSGAALWEFDPRWTLLTVAVTEWMRKATSLPIDFQIQPIKLAHYRRVEQC